MKILFSFFSILLISGQLCLGQHYYNDAFTAQKADSYTIDGVGDEPFWESCDWYNIEYVWIPYGGTMVSGDFTGRVKFAWTQEKLLVLAEIEDDVLSDTHVDPQSNFYNDDCFELFLDEDYSGGWHQNSYNAFAYHCAINEEDVIDSGDDDASNVNLKDHIEFDLDTVDATHYVWELAITIYDDSFNESNASNTSVSLYQNKEMGIAVAYCDNDGGTERENFIGLVNVAAEHFNSAWQDASVFGKLTLDGPVSGVEEISLANAAEDIGVYMNNMNNLVIQNLGDFHKRTIISIYDLNGRLLKESSVYLKERTTLDIDDFSMGTYIVNLKADNLYYSSLFYKLK